MSVIVSGRGPSSRRLSGQNEGHFGLDAFVHHTAGETSGFHRFCDTSGMVDRVNGTHMIAMPMFFLAAIRLADTQGRAEQGGFNIVNAQGISAQQGLNPAVFNECSESGSATGVDDDGAGNHDDLLSCGARLLH